MSLPTYMTIREAADTLGVSRERVYAWIKSGRLPVAARSEYAGFLISRRTIERLGHALVDSLQGTGERSRPDACHE